MTKKNSQQKDRSKVSRLKSSWSHSYPTLSVGLVTRDKSLTVPGQALNIQDAIDRFTRGMGVEHYVPSYLDGLPIEVPEFEKMSRLERLDWAAENRTKINELRKEYEKTVGNFKEEPQPVAQVTESETEKTEKE